MNTTQIQTADTQLRAALRSPSSSARLQAVLAAGTTPDPGYVEALVAQCAVEPDFFVRDMLSWALLRHPKDVTVPRLVAETKSDVPQARSQALHTLSKIGEGWSAITDELLRDPDDEVARSAWRAAVVLAPEEERKALADKLSTQFGRGDRKVQLSLRQALAALGAATANPDEGLEEAIFEAKKIAALHNAPIPPEGASC